MNGEIGESKLMILLTEKKEELNRKLDERYEECKEIHKKPDKENNSCNYCFRRINYHTRSERILRSRNGVDRMHIPYDAAYWSQEQRSEMDMKRNLDKLTGLSSLAKELYPELLD